MIVASDISKAYSTRTLFSGLTLSLATGDRIALVGANGSGKTTLMDVLAGDIAPDTGKVSKQRHVTIGYLKQEPGLYAGKSLLQEVLDAASEVNTLVDEIVAAQEALSAESDPVQQGYLLDRISKLDMALEAAGGADREHEAKAILSGLGFQKRDFLRPINEFSGGWIMRASLARILFRKPNLLLLDEPTNHLDLDANLWFEKYLASFQGGVLVTSHDRTFLNQTATRVLAIEPDEVVLHGGNYDDYLVARERDSSGQAGGLRQAGARGSEANAIHRSFSLEGQKGKPGAKPFEATRKDGDHQVAKGHQEGSLLVPETPARRFRDHNADQRKQVLRR